MLGKALLSGNTATLSTSGLGAGTDAITGVYSGDSNCAGSTSPVPGQVVNIAATTESLRFLAASICRGTSGDSHSHGKFVRGSADREREVHERRRWAGHGHTQRWCSHSYDDHAAGGVGPDHGELFRRHELRNQFGFADSGRAMTLGEATEAALAKGPLASASACTWLDCSF